MAVEPRALKFIATEEKGEVSALYARPRGAKALLVLGHGSGTNIRHRFMQELSDALNDVGIATFRFNYPYSEKGRWWHGWREGAVGYCACGYRDGDEAGVRVASFCRWAFNERADGIDGLCRGTY